MRFVQAMTAALAGLSFGAADAADITVAPPLESVLVTPYPKDSMESLVAQGARVDLTSLIRIHVEGEIKEGDGAVFTDLLNAQMEQFGGDISTYVVVTFNSPGGSYLDGLQIADAIGFRNAATYVGPGDECLSACAFAWLGGRQELIRRVFWEPQRYVHVDATLGFHAPFVGEFPEEVGEALSAGGVEVIGTFFYEVATESIREVQTRLPGWQVEPDFVFEFLGRGPDEFLFVDDADFVYRNRFTVVAVDSNSVTYVNALNAVAACPLVLSQMVAPADGYRRNFALGPVDLTDPNTLKFSWQQASVTEQDDGRGRMDLDMIIAGRGPFTCSLHSFVVDEWSLNIDGDLPLVETWMGHDPAFAGTGADYPLNIYVALGAGTPWRALRGADLYLSRDPFETVPAEHRTGPGPSFNCSGDLDPAARVICTYPVLAEADGILVSAYKARRDQDGVKDAQRAWLRARETQCRSAYIDFDSEVAQRMAGYCLLGATLARIDELLR